MVRTDSAKLRAHTYPYARSRLPTRLDWCQTEPKQPDGPALEPRGLPKGLERLPNTRHSWRTNLGNRCSLSRPCPKMHRTSSSN